MLLPPMEVLKHELSISKTLLNQDAHISTKEGLVDLVAKIEIQIHSLDIASNNWITEITIVIQLFQ